MTSLMMVQTSLLHLPVLRMLPRGAQLASQPHSATQLASHSPPSRPHFLENFPRCNIKYLHLPTERSNTSQPLTFQVSLKDAGHSALREGSW